MLHLLLINLFFLETGTKRKATKTTTKEPAAKKTSKNAEELVAEVIGESKKPKESKKSVDPKQSMEPIIIEPKNPTSDTTKGKWI